MPEPVAQFEEPYPVLVRHDSAIPVQVGEIRDTRAEPMILALSHVPRRAVALELAKTAGERDLLVVGYVLVAEHQDGILIHAGVDGGDLLRAERLAAIDARNFSDEDRVWFFKLGDRLWHSDSSFRPVPAKYSVLSGRILPSWGANTEFADMRAAYDALDDRTKAEIEELICEHSLVYSREAIGFTDLTPEEIAAFRPVRQRLVRTHPATRRKSLFLASHAGAIIGWTIPEARMFLRDLTEHATQREFVYSHSWKPYDLVMWDNRATMHRARRFDRNEVRDVRRTTLAGDAATVEQVA